jgi:hypothetical protein
MQQSMRDRCYAQPASAGWHTSHTWRTRRQLIAPSQAPELPLCYQHVVHPLEQYKWGQSWQDVGSWGCASGRQLSLGAITIGERLCAADKGDSEVHMRVRADVAQSCQQR